MSLSANDLAQRFSADHGKHAVLLTVTGRLIVQRYDLFRKPGQKPKVKPQPEGSTLLAVAYGPRKQVYRAAKEKYDNAV